MIQADKIKITIIHYSALPICTVDLCGNELRKYIALLYKHQSNTNWAFVQKRDIFTCENITVAMAS